LARQCFVLFFDQFGMALSDFVAFNRLGPEFVCDLVALRGLCEKSIHRTPPIFQDRRPGLNIVEWPAGQRCRSAQYERQ